VSSHLDRRPILKAFKKSARVHVHLEYLQVERTHLLYFRPENFSNLEIFESDNIRGICEDLEGQSHKTLLLVALGIEVPNITLSFNLH
jgi:hypothetical protein